MVSVSERFEYCQQSCKENTALFFIDGSYEVALLLLEGSHGLNLTSLTKSVSATWVSA
jgi:hypothetical protein